jgi:hypothetical protein
MKHVLKSIVVLALMASAGGAWALGARNAEVLDYSTRSLISEDDAKKIVGAAIPANVWKIFPATKYVFVSQVEGGVTAAGICAVTARVMLMPLTPTARAVLFRPQKTATTFDAVPASGADPCKATAAAKLKEAALAVVAAIVKT